MLVNTTTLDALKNFQFFTLDSEDIQPQQEAQEPLQAFNSLHWIHVTINIPVVTEDVTFNSLHWIPKRSTHLKRYSCISLFQFFTLDSKLDL